VYLAPIALLQIGEWEFFGFFLFAVWYTQVFKRTTLGQSSLSNIIEIAKQRASKTDISSWGLDQDSRKPGERG
jgi:hypothetical protein